MPGTPRTIEPDGSVSAGSKQAVLAAYRAGSELRVGWWLDFDADGRPDISPTSRRCGRPGS